MCVSFTVTKFVRGGALVFVCDCVLAFSQRIPRMADVSTQTQTSICLFYFVCWFSQSSSFTLCCLTVGFLCPLYLSSIRLVSPLNRCLYILLTYFYNFFLNIFAGLFGKNIKMYVHLSSVFFLFVGQVCVFNRKPVAAIPGEMQSRNHLQCDGFYRITGWFHLFYV